MSIPMEVDQSLKPSQMDAQEFNRRVEERITEYKKDHPGFFSHETRIGSNQEILFDIILTLHAPHINLDEEQRSESLDSYELFSALRLAYRTKSFADLRENRRLLVATNALDNTDAGGPLVRSVSDRSPNAAFREPYLGEADQLLISALNEYRNLKDQGSKQRPYNYSISVIQSSGMGKSRMVDQAANSILTLPLNIREHLESGYASPPPDAQVRDHLLSHHGKSDKELQKAYAIFLRVLFDKAAEKVATIGGGKTGVELASVWAEYLREGLDTAGVATHRQAFLNDVVALSNSCVTDSMKQSRGENSLSLSLKAMSDSCDRLVELVFPNRPKGNNAVFVYFDEAHELTKAIGRPTATRQRSAYHNLGTVLTSLNDSPVFFIFLSTNSHLQWSPPPAAYHPSNRAFNGTYLIPPFTELPCDLFGKKVIQNLMDAGKAVSLENVCGIDVMVGWHAHYRQFLESHHAVKRIFVFAQDKLTSCGNIDKGPVESDLAALGVRIGITFDTMMASVRQLESHLVESHMRVVYSIPVHREFMHTGSPSEPVLAEAAARYLHARSGHSGIQSLGPKILARICEQGFLARGERGELCGRLLMTSAHDIAIHGHLAKLGISKPESDQAFFHQPVPVLDFLCALFVDRFHETVPEAKSVSRKYGVPTLKDAFAESFVSFSHFALALDSEMLTSPYLALALVRGMALQAKDNPHSTDLVIPIHMGPIMEPISGDTTSVINLQTKNRKQPVDCNVIRQLTVPDPKQPVISIIIEFGNDKELVHVQERSHRMTRSNEGMIHYDDHHYEIVAHGRGAGTFKAIPREAEAHYEAILATQSAVSDFPRRQSDKHLAAFESLNRGFASSRSDWIELPEPVKKNDH